MNDSEINWFYNDYGETLDDYLSNLHFNLGYITCTLTSNNILKIWLDSNNDTEELRENIKKSITEYLNNNG